MNSPSESIIKICLLLSLSLFFSCNGNTQKSVEKDTAASGQNAVRYAKRYRLEDKKWCSQLTIINPWQGAGNVIQKWYLVKDGQKIPEGIDTSLVIKTPVRKIICMSTTHLAMISTINETETVKGFSGTGFLYGKDFRERVAEGKIHEVGYEDNLNKEIILDIAPDLIMVYGIESESAGYTGKLKELGVKVMFNADYLETDPLGKAEWIKVFGALYGKEKMADSVFNAGESRYNQIRHLIEGRLKNRPAVLLGLPFRDTWYISPGNSYISKLISDAGGRYLWAGTESSFSMPMGIEAVYTKGLQADFWLNTGTASAFSDITAIDSRLADLPAFKSGNIYNNNNRINSDGGNDYWEYGCINPDVVLADMVTIFHPDIFPGRELVYYRKLK